MHLFLHDVALHTHIFFTTFDKLPSTVAATGVENWSTAELENPDSECIIISTSFMGLHIECIVISRPIMGLHMECIFFSRLFMGLATEIVCMERNPSCGQQEIDTSWNHLCHTDQLYVLFCHSLSWISIHLCWHWLLIWCHWWLSLKKPATCVTEAVDSIIYLQGSLCCCRQVLLTVKQCTGQEEDTPNVPDQFFRVPYALHNYY